MSPNLKAFLDMIAVSEGTAGKGDDGYNVIVGGSLFESYADHPRKLVWVRPGLASTAAGRYQLLSRYYDAYKKQLNLPNFSPLSQDLIAIQQIKERGALQDIEKGYISIAIDKVKNIWASLPGAGYNQHENKLDKLITAYKDAGGTVA
jgi:muramidase (phage lysozyme)